MALSLTLPRKPRSLRAALVLGMAGWALTVAAQTATPQEPPARGFIVKLKRSAITTASGQRESAQATRDRLASITARQRITYLDSHQTALDGAHVLNYRRWLSATEARTEADRLRTDPDVEWVTINSLEKRQAVADPDDTYYANSVQSWIRPPGGSVGIPNIRGAWDILSTVTTVHPVVTAVLDSGVRFDHPDLAGQLLPGYDFVSEYDYANDGDGLDPDASDPGDWVSAVDRLNANSFGDGCDLEDSSWHGTHIAGQLAAATNNAKGISGILWQLQAANAGNPVLLPVRVAGKCGAVVSDIVEGMYWAAGISYAGSPALNPHPARVISLSFGSVKSCSTGESAAYVEAVSKLKEVGVLVVAAAGNGAAGSPGAANATRPANCQGVLAVTSVNQNGAKSYYANLITTSFGGVTGLSGVATVGGDSTSASSTSGLYSTSNAGTTAPVGYVGDGVYDYKAGTSFATPIAAGVAAMILSINPNLSTDDVRTLITGNVTAWGAFGPATTCSPELGYCRCSSSTCGSGILNATSALTAAQTATPTDSALVTRLAGNDAVTSGTVTSAFVPTRGSSTSRRSTGGGGGGAVQPVWVGGLALAIGVLAARGRRQRRG